MARARMAGDLCVQSVHELRDHPVSRCVVDAEGCDRMVTLHEQRRLMALASAHTTTLQRHCAAENESGARLALVVSLRGALVRLVELALEIGKFFLNETAGILDRLVVYGRAELPKEEVEDEPCLKVADLFL